MAKDRHSKYKNTGILFELLVRQITNDMMLGNKKSPAVSLVREFFKKGSSLNRELQLYQTLQKTKFTREDKANTLIDTQHIKTAAITTALIGTAQITDAEVANMNVNKLTSGSIPCHNLNASEA